MLDGDELTLTDLLLDQVSLEPARFTATDTSLVINDLPASVPFEITVVTELSPETNTQLMGLYRTSNVYCTQCEAEGFRRITYFPDRPDVLSVYNGQHHRRQGGLAAAALQRQLSRRRRHGRWPHFAAWFDPHPKPSYLFALVAGDLGTVEDRFVTMSGREVTLRIHVEHGNEPKAAYAMDALKRSMKWDEEAFGANMTSTSS